MLRLILPEVPGGMLAVENTDHLYAKEKWVSGDSFRGSDKLFYSRHGQDNLCYC